MYNLLCELVPLDLELWYTGNSEEMRDYIDNLNEFLSSFEEYPDMRVADRYIGEYMCIARIKIRHFEKAAYSNEINYVIVK